LENREGTNDKMPRRVWKKIVDEKDKARMTKVKREKRRI